MNLEESLDRVLHRQEELSSLLSDPDLAGTDKFIEYSKEYSAAGVNNHIARDLAQFVGNESQLDDMTLIVIDKT